MRMEHFEIYILKLIQKLISQKLMGQLNWNFVYFLQSFPTTCGYRRLSLAALAGQLADKWVRILTLLPNTHSVISVQFLSPISSTVSSVRTWRRRLTFLFFTELVSLNLLACILIVLGLGTGHPGNFTRNLRRVSEHDFLLFIYILWIYTLHTMTIPVYACHKSQ